MKLAHMAVAVVLALISPMVGGAQEKQDQDKKNMNTAGRILVVYYSRSGNTERVAKDVAARLGADLEKISDKANRQGFTGYLGASYDSLRNISADIAEPKKNPAEYAVTVVGTPVWAWNMTPAARAYLEKTKGKSRDMAFFVTSGNTDAGQIVPGMEEVAGRKAIAFTGFNSKELQDPAVYEKKLAAFVAAVKSRSQGAMRK
jgi:flavodoxin